MDLLLVGVLGLVAIAAATAFGPKIGVATPLLLVALGIVVSLLPVTPTFTVDPEWILLGVLPPLLYSTSVSMPSMNFRREFGAIGGLSVVLVIASSVLLGLFFAAVIPGLPLPWAIALGAIVSPTDAVATSIIKRIGVSPRAIAILEGESLLNDATALVTLKSAIAAVSFGFSLGGAVGTFVYSVVVALAIGYAVGRLNLWVRSKVKDATVNTVISFAVPFIASLPAERLGASGLVAAVVAGLVTGTLAPRMLSPQHRVSDSQNWRTVELVLEGALFLAMGLQMSGIAGQIAGESIGVGSAIGIAAGALLLTLLIRAAYIAPLIGLLRDNARRFEQAKPRMTSLQQKIESGEPLVRTDGRRTADGPERDRTPRSRPDRPPREVSPGRIALISKRITRGLADIEYLRQEPLGWKEGSIIVWAGMRGAVTLAAAQTLPEGADGAPHRALLVFIAFVVAAGSLLVQGGTIAWLVRLVGPAAPDPVVAGDERDKLLALMRTAAATAGDGVVPDESDKPGRMRMLAAQRAALLDARDDGTFSADVLGYALEIVDADQISLEMKGGPEG